MERRRTARPGLLVLLGALLGALLLGGPAAAQEPYPPGPPGEPDPSVDCTLRATETARVAECTGSGLKPGSTITVEVTISDAQAAAAAAPGLATVSLLSAAVTLAQSDDVDASGSGTVGADGSGNAQAEIGCDETGTVTVRGEGEAPDDPDGEPSVTDELVRDLEDYPCTGDDAAAAPTPRDRTGALPFTGADLLMLLLIALLLLLAGYGVLRSRPRRPAA